MKWLKKVAATPLTTIARVVDNLNAQTNDRTNAPSIHAVREAINNNWLSIYPVGSIYMSVNNVNPSTVFGGTWERIKDRFLLSSGDQYTAGATAGSDTYTPQGTVEEHTLTKEELPNHNHTYNEVLDINSAETPLYPHYHTLEYKAYNASLSAGNTGVMVYSDDITQTRVETSVAGDNPHTHTHTVNESVSHTSSVGGGNGHSHSFTGIGGNNMPPYLVVNTWVRRA